MTVERIEVRVNGTGLVTLEIDVDWLTLSDEEFRWVRRVAEMVRAGVGAGLPDEEPDPVVAADAVAAEGREPAAEPEPDPAAKTYRCEEHDETFPTPQKLGAHRRYHHRPAGGPTVTPPAPRRKVTPAAEPEKKGPRLATPDELGPIHRTPLPRTPADLGPAVHHVRGVHGS